MVDWYVDEGLQQFDRQWLEKYPGATIYHIGDINHSINPDVSQHAPEKVTGPQPGRDKGEVDAGDYMPGKTVSMFNLREEFAALHKSRDPRILYCILEDKIFSSVTYPWDIRPYKGKFHNHLHLSVNDNFDKNTSDWEALTVAEQLPWDYEEVNNAKLPKELKYGMEDAAYGGWNHIGRTQSLLNYMEKTLEPLDCDGVYGAYTVKKAAKFFKNNGKVMTIDDLCLLHGFSK
jgi:hypothetical protein